MRIDAHSHYYPRALDGRLDSAGPLVARTRGGFVRGFSLHVGADKQLAIIDAAGIDRQVQSLWHTQPYAEDVHRAVGPASSRRPCAARARPSVSTA